MIWFCYSLQWIGNKTPSRSGSGFQIHELSKSIDLQCSEQALAENDADAAQALWQAENEFLHWAALSHPDHVLVRWESHLGSLGGSKISQFRSGFTASE